MIYNAELYIMRREIEQVGKTRAVDRVTSEAWYRALQGAKPKHSMILDRTEVDEYEDGSLRAYKIRFIFLIDTMNVAANVATTRTIKDILHSDA